MTRALALLLALTATAPAGPSVGFLDGRALPGALLLEADATRARLSAPDGERVVPTRELATVRLPDAGNGSADGPPNLFLAGGDRLRGTVRGDGDHVRLDGQGVTGLRIPLAAVRAVRFGRLLAGLQVRYDETFRRELAEGRDVVVVQRDTKPFPVAARVLRLDEETLTVLVGEEQRELAAHRVYGFVRAPVAGAAPPEGIAVRIHLAGDARITLPLENITPAEVLAGGARIERAAVALLEFLGPHVADLADLDPIDVQQVALFGAPPPWRRNAMVLGGPMRLDGRPCPRGLGVHAYARLEYVLAGRWTGFFARCGIDEAAGGEGDALFRVLGDGRVLAEVRRRRGEASAALLLDVTGIDRLVLEAVPGDSYVSDFCDWAEARVFRLPPGGEGSR